MSTYAIGDVQGCYDELCDLLEQLAFDPACDRLLFSGDLVNRGPHSLRTLRLVRDLGKAAVVVLGNHDLHLLALAHGAKKSDPGTLLEILHAPDREELIHWLAQHPLAHYEAAAASLPASLPGSLPGFLLVHAGIAPSWDHHDTLALAAEVSKELRGPEASQLLGKLYGDEPSLWKAELTGDERLRCITNHLTRMRYCQVSGRLDFHCQGPPGTQKAGLQPWFTLPRQRSLETPLLFGHWASLGIAPQDLAEEFKVYPLDSGCVWGGRLSALRLEDLRLYSVPARERGTVRR